MNRCSAVGTDDEFGGPRAEGVDRPGHRYGRPTWRQRGTPDDVDGGWIRGIRGSPERYEGSDDQRACWGCRRRWVTWLTGLHSCRSYLNYGLNARQRKRLHRHSREER
jgi:hypothetical protein